MKKFKKLTAILLLCAMVFHLAGPGTALKSSAAKKPVLNPKKVTIRVGQAKKIILKNAKKAKKTTWKAKPAKAIKLLKKGKTSVTIRGVKKTRKVVLTAKFKLGKKKKMAKCTIKVNAKPKDNVTVKPTVVPTDKPTVKPTVIPTLPPTEEPTEGPMRPKQPVQSARPFPSDYPQIATLPKTTSIPNLLKFFKSQKDVTAENWKDRMDEVRELYQVYMYGMYRSGEEITAERSDFTLNQNNNNVTNLSVTVTNEKSSGTITAAITLPSGEAPELGWPAMIGFGGIADPNKSRLLERGYAVIDFMPNQVAPDQAGRRGIFYDLYPYGQGTYDWKNQTGALMAWAWGVSKIIDGLETGIGDELNINQDILMISGVSRYGKAAAVTGAFDKRIRVTVPGCSGAAGMICMRYDPNKLTFNLSSLEDFAAGADQTCTYGPIGNDRTGTEGFGSLTSGSEAHWFNTTFASAVSGYNGTNVAFPFDQHFLAALCVEEDRLLFGTSEFVSGMWTNAPGHWMTYLKAQETLKVVGLEDNYAIRFHRDGHRLQVEDIDYLLDFVEFKLFHRKPKKNLANLGTSLFETNAENKAAFESKMPPSL